jgi:hypothetical protein
MPYPGKGVGLYFQRAGRDRTGKSLNAAYNASEMGVSNDCFGEGAPDDAPEL